MNRNKRRISIKTAAGLGLAFLFLSLSLLEAQETEGPGRHFRINLQGYLPGQPAKALLLSDEELETPIVSLRRSDGSLAVELKLIEMGRAWEPFDHYYGIDLPKDLQAGAYYLEHGQKGQKQRSATFRISSYPSWQETVVDFIRSQRCGFNPYTGKPCHQQDGLSFFGKRPDSSYINATGGWHDAGDQLKYLITGSNTTARLLMAYRMEPSAFRDHYDRLGMPGGNGLPDILDEAVWGLDWILKLHPAPGELYHQVADDRDHRGFKWPHEDNADYGWGSNSYRPVYAATGEPQGLSQYKSKATGISNLAGRSAATLALAFEVFHKLEGYEAFAESCLQAALELYRMGREKEGYQQGNSFGAPYRYEENTWADDMEWAAAQLYRVTGKTEYLEQARHYANKIGAWSWMERDTASHYEMYPFVNMGHYALWQVGNDKDKELAVSYYRQNLERIAARAASNPYRVGHLFIWCSNNLAAAVATQAMLYEEMSGSDEYRELMHDHINWLLGLNPWGSSMITGLPAGADSPYDVHMPFWRLDSAQISGSLVDGPLWSTIHSGMLGIELAEPDEYAAFQPEHIRYMDDYLDYSTNEPTLDGSAELLMLLTQLSSRESPVLGGETFRQQGAERHQDAVQNQVRDSQGALVRSDTSKKRVYLCFTIHDRYEGLDHVLGVLDKEGEKASFFVTGDFVREHPQKLRRIATGGHFVGAHSDRHLLYCSWEKRDSLLYSPHQIREDIRMNLVALAAEGIYPESFMPPYEWYDNRVVELAAELGQNTVNFTPGIRTNADYTTPDMSSYLSTAGILDLLFEKEGTDGLNGCHILIHPGTVKERTDKLYLQLEFLIGELRERGYSFGAFK